MRKQDIADWLGNGLGPKSVFATHFLFFFWFSVANFASSLCADWDENSNLRDFFMGVFQ